MKEEELKEKIYKKFKKKIIESIKILSFSKLKIHFKFKGFSGVYNVNMKTPKAPTWFKDWNENAFKPLVSKVDILENKVDNLEVKVDNLEVKVDKNTERLENIIKKNKLEE